MLEVTVRPHYVLSILFKKIVAKNGGLHKLVLNEPLDFLLRDVPSIKNFSIKFDGEAFGDPTGSRTLLTRMRT